MCQSPFLIKFRPLARNIIEIETLYRRPLETAFRKKCFLELFVLKMDSFIFSKITKGVAILGQIDIYYKIKSLPIVHYVQIPKFKAAEQKLWLILQKNQVIYSLDTGPNLNVLCTFNSCLQKQSSRGFLSKRCSWKFRKIHRKTPVSETFLNKDTGLRFATLLKESL